MRCSSASGYLRADDSVSPIDAEAVEKMLTARGAARRARDWRSADAIRDALGDMGVGVHDGDMRWFVVRRRELESMSAADAQEKSSAPRPVVPQNIPLTIVYEDEDMMAIDKPPGMAVQFAKSALENAVVFHLNATSASAGGARWQSPAWPWKSDESFEGVVHRLDKGTSGLVVVAKHPRAARALSAAFRERRVGKTYLAVAVGLPSESTLRQPTLEGTVPTLESFEATNALANNSKESAINFPSKYLGSADPRQKRLARAIKDCGRDAEQALARLDHASTAAGELAGERPSAVCYSAVIDVCVRAGQRETALSVLDSMRRHGVTPNVPCFQAAIGLCAREPPLWRNAVELLERMRDEYGVGPDAHCFSSAISACGRAGELGVALGLLDIVEAGRRDRASSARDSAASPDHEGECMVLRAAIRACEREGAADMASVLAGRLQQLASGGDPAAEPAERSVGVGVALAVDAPIGKLGSRLMGIVPVAEGGREARSTVTPLAFDGVYSLNRVVIETGRMHQIRVHMGSVIGCPLAGDRAYGGRHNHGHKGATALGTRLGAARAPVRRPMLHAAELVLPHPTTGAEIRLRCPPPPDFMALAGGTLGSAAQMGDSRSGAMSDAEATAEIMQML